MPIEVRIESLAAGGDGVGRTPEGRVLFVPFTAPGDFVSVRVVEARKRFARGEIEEVLERSPDRVEPRCPVFGTCGGCAWQHVGYEAQVRAKARIVADALARIGHLDWPGGVRVTPSPAPYGYRNRARLVRARDGLGYRMRRSGRVQVVHSCPILVPALSAALGRQIEPSQEGVEWELAAGADGKVRAQPFEGGGGTRNPIALRIAEQSLRISPGVFAQGNSFLLDALASAVNRAAGAGTTALELFAGAGFLTLGLAQSFDYVQAVESHPGAIEDLTFNLKSAGIENVEVIAGPVEKVLEQAIRNPDVLILDPPRTGLSEPALEAILASEPKKIVYLSCDPATLARDLKGMRTGGYTLQEVEAFDLFPQTPHVEVLATLSR